MARGNLLKKRARKARREQQASVVAAAAAEAPHRHPVGRTPQRVGGVAA